MRNRIIVLVAAVLALSSCGSDDAKGLGDAPVGERHEAPRQIWVAPDLFGNVAAWCIGPNGVYMPTADVQPVVIKDDANCAEGGLLAP